MHYITKRDKKIKEVIEYLGLLSPRVQFNSQQRYDARATIGHAPPHLLVDIYLSFF